MDGWMHWLRKKEGSWLIWGSELCSQEDNMYHELRQSRQQGEDCVWEDGEFGLGLLSLICRWGLQVERSIHAVINTGQSQRK